MIISTFNWWSVVMPMTIVIAFALAILSVTKKKARAKWRGPKRLWQALIWAYSAAVWIVLVMLYITESIRGMIQFWGPDSEGVLFVSFATFFVVAAIWAWLTHATFFRVHDWYFKRVDDAIQYSHFESEPIAPGKIVKFPPTSQQSGSESPESQPSESPEAQSEESTSDDPLQQIASQYRIDECDDLEVVYHDADGAHPISELLPEGTQKYYVAVNTEQEEAQPIFLGWENPKENLLTYLRSLIGEEEAASNQ